MKRFLWFLGLLLTAAAQAQTADEIIQKYTASMGGLDAFNKVTSAKITGNIINQGMPMPLTIQLINNKAVRTDVDAMGQEIVTVYNKGTGWKINPYAGAETATELSGQELIDARLQASLANNLMDYKKRGHSVELAGQEDVEGIKCYKIKVVSADDKKEMIYFINTADYLLIKTTATRDIQGQEMEVETFYSDLKDFGGIKFYMTRSMKIQGQVFQEVKLDKVELNVPVDENIFKM